VRYTLQTLITDRVAATCVTVDLAAGYSGLTASDLSAIDARRRDRYLNLELNEEIADRAREVQVLLAEKMQHRTVGILDLLTAAVAEYHDAALMHYHPAFELISSITGQPQLWVASWGSLEAEAKADADAVGSNGLAADTRVSPPAQMPHPMDDPISQRPEL
jgi:predicted nucleic acid-binding protein